MRKFLRNCTALLLAVAALLWLGGTAYRQTTAYRNLERTEETEKYREMPERIAFAVFGPSHGRDAFQKEDYGEGFFNFSMSSQTPQYDWMQLREFQDRLAPGATVVLTVSYLSPFWTDSAESFGSKQERYYRILHPENIVDCDVGHWVLERWSPLLTTECGEILSAFLQPQELREDTNTLYGRQELTQEMLESERARISRSRPSRRRVSPLGMYRLCPPHRSTRVRKPSSPRTSTRSAYSAGMSEGRMALRSWMLIDINDVLLSFCRMKCGAQERLRSASTAFNRAKAVRKRARAAPLTPELPGKN